MDFENKQNLSFDGYFQESLIINRLFKNNRELSEHLSQKQPLDFNIEDSVDYFINKEEMPLPKPLKLDDCRSNISDVQAEDTKQIEDSIQQRRKYDDFPELDILNIQNQEQALKKVTQNSAILNEETPSTQQLKIVIDYLVQNSNQSIQEIRQSLGPKFRQVLQTGVVVDLIEKFNRLKKTKEQLVKYCMRKAFKFILELPKNKHLLQVDREEKFSFSKCKHRFLKNISEEKSMNNKFLKQIFSQKEFSADYQLFLEHFERIIEEDNKKKVKFLAELLATQKEGKSRTVQMVKRLPWTNAILERVKKISRQLMKYSDQR